MACNCKKNVQQQRPQPARPTQPKQNGFSGKRIVKREIK